MLRALVLIATLTQQTHTAGGFELPVDHSVVSITIDGRDAATTPDARESIPPSAQYFDDRTKLMNLYIMVGMEPGEIRGQMVLRLKTGLVEGKPIPASLEWTRTTKSYDEVAYTAKAAKVVITQFETHAVEGGPKQGTVSGTFEAAMTSKAPGKKSAPLVTKGKFEKVSVHVISGELE